jgi:hypothetical protein
MILSAVGPVTTEAHGREVDRFASTIFIATGGPGNYASDPSSYRRSRERDRGLKAFGSRTPDRLRARSGRNRSHDVDGCYLRPTGSRAAEEQIITVIKTRAATAALVGCSIQEAERPEDRSPESPQTAASSAAEARGSTAAPTWHASKRCRTAGRRRWTDW